MMDKSTQGKRNRKKGRKFEQEVREDLNSRGWIVCRWGNTIDFEKDKIVPAKPKFNPFRKMMALGTGFPDYIIFRPAEATWVLGVECKGGKGGYLSKEENRMVSWYRKHRTFKDFIVARRPKAKEDPARKVVYEIRGAE
jgi:hypothetical protein